MRAVALLFPALLAAQTAPVRVTISHQPLEAFTAAFSSRVKGIALYRARACNLSPDLTTVVSGGRLLLVAESRISAVDPALLAQIAAKGKRQTKLYKTAKAVEWAALFASVLTAGGTIAASDAVKVIFPLLAVTGDRLSGELAGRGIAPNALELVTDSHLYELDPGACVAGLFLGSWSGKEYQPFSETIELPGVPGLPPIERPAMRR